MDQQRAAREAAETFIAAIVSGDGAAIASLISAKAQAELLQVVRRWVAGVVTAQEAAAIVWGGPWTALFADVRVDDVEIDGERATATYSHLTFGRDDDDFFALADIDGRWLIDAFPEDDEDEIPAWALT